MPHRLYFPMLNERFDVKHIAGDYKQSSISDEAVYQRAKQQHRLIITYTTKDFYILQKQSLNTGIIGISPHLSINQIDKKLTAFLIRKKPKDLYGKLVTLTGETKR